MALSRSLLWLAAAAWLSAPQAAEWRPVQVPGPRKASEARNFTCAR